MLEVNLGIIYGIKHGGLLSVSNKLMAMAEQKYLSPAAKWSPPEQDISPLCPDIISLGSGLCGTCIQLLY
jgi:hypothetical protein